MSWSIANRCSLCKRNEESIDHLFIRLQSWAAATRKVSDNECNVWLRTICDFRPP
ncbi:hypothetical protein LINGRAHAP2_LOCUS3540 [Linum grandiflorum]